jgi:hypothetical protein
MAGLERARPLTVTAKRGKGLAMPRYYFNIRNADGVLIPDLEGSELPDIATACNEARRSARGLAIDEIRGSGSVDESVVEIADESGRVVTKMSIADVIAVPDK